MYAAVETTRGGTWGKAVTKTGDEKVVAGRVRGVVRKVVTKTGDEKVDEN